MFIIQEKMLKEGMKLSYKKVIGPEETAAKAAPGALEVFGTPMLIGFMEKVCLDLAAKEISSEESTVGISVNMKHLKANNVGDEISCEAVLTKVEGKKLTFELKAYFGEELIGEATHERFIINIDKFLSKLKKK